MADLTRRDPLEGLAAPGRTLPGLEPVTLERPPFRAKLTLRGGPAVEAAASAALGFPLPGLLASANGGGVDALRLGPDAWLLLLAAGDAVALADRLRAALGGHAHALVEVSERFTAVAVDGRPSRAVLNAGCALDLHPSAFPRGRVARTLLGKATVILRRPATDDRFELLVDGSLAPYLWRFLENAALEHGVRVPG